VIRREIKKIDGERYRDGEGDRWRYGGDGMQ
jgi:hypothetical protein